MHGKTPGRKFDLRAISVGATVEGVVLPLLFVVVGAVDVGIVVGPVVGGIVAGATSRTYRSEYVDGAGGAVVGLFLSPFFGMFFEGAGVAVPGLALLMLFALGGTIIALPMGAVVGQVAARVRERPLVAPA